MPFEKGGLADKLGNRYEGFWLVSKLLELLDEKLLSVTVEAIGDDEKGVDIWVVKNDGDRIAYQCKARNSSEEFWSLSNLSSRGVLSNIKFQLDRDPKAKFVFVSSVGSEVFQSICEFSRRSDNNPKLFVDDKIYKRGQKIIKCFESFCKYLSLNNVEAFHYLTRTYITVYPDDQENRNSLSQTANSLILGEPDLAVSTLLEYAQIKDRYGAKIYADELREYLSQNGLYPKRLEHDDRIIPAISNLQREFSYSISPQLIGGVPIQREETNELIDAIINGSNIIVSGVAGYGKSCVLYELTESLKQEKILYLPIRLDRREPEKNAAQFGKDMGLPDCPAFSLSAVAGERRSVLILDQLDAIRWTSSHSNHALDVCKEILQHVKLKRLSGNRISIILCCRLFDLENDPSIRSWLNQEHALDFVTIKVNALPFETIEKVVGPPFSTMGEKEKKLLASPFNLSIWKQLNEIGDSFHFRSASELMKEFWKNRYLTLDEQAHIPPDQVKQALSPLVDYMESQGKISAPARIAESYPKIAEALYSYGIIQQSFGRVSFCHQCYLDFLIASRLLKQIDESIESIFKWLGPKEKQSLFRREQLRQALAMLADESKTRFLRISQEILLSKEVRFHIKHLLLELIGTLDEIPDELGKYCLKLYCDVFWKDHIFETVFIGHAPHAKYLCNEGVVEHWFDSGCDEAINNAFRMLGSVADSVPDVVADILEKYVDKDRDLAARANAAIGWRIEHDSDHLFKFRLKLARLKEFPSLVSWVVLYKRKQFLRIAQLLEAILSSSEINDDLSERDKQERIGTFYDRDIEVVKKVGGEIPIKTWDYLTPQIERLTQFKSKPYDTRQDKWREDYHYDSHRFSIYRVLVGMTVSAGKKLAQEHTTEFLIRTQSLLKSKSPVIQDILIETLKYLPPDHAGYGINWLLSDTQRFQLGLGWDEPKWQPAVRLVKALSSHCSVALYRELERTIVNYHEPYEKRTAEYCLIQRRKGSFPYYWGEAQYFLLAALASERLSPKTASLIQVLNRKFAGHSKYRFTRLGRIRGGRVGSKLDPNLHNISDRAWLDIVRSPKVKSPNDKGYKQIAPDMALKTSVNQFSNSLRKIALIYPVRFVRLAMRFPNDVEPAYIQSIIDSCGEKTPASNLPEEIKREWAPVSSENIEALIEKYLAGHDRTSASNFCSLISKRSDENWSESTLNRLIEYAKSHPDPEPGELNYHNEILAKEASVNILGQNTSACVRGLAAQAISSLLWENPELLEKLRPGILSLIRDGNPAVRMAAANMLIPIINIDKDLAVEWFCEACNDELRAAASIDNTKFFNYTTPSHIKQLAPLLKEMASSEWEDVSEEGARQITARWLFTGFFELEFLSCQSGSIPQRKGVADAAAQLIWEDRYSEACIGILRPLLNDPEKDVRANVRRLFRTPKKVVDNSFEPFLLEYINSQTFADNPELFIWKMKDYTGPIIFLAETIFSICSIFCSTLQPKSREVGSSVPSAISDTIPMLLRLYESAISEENVKISNRCLDIWDSLFVKRVGFVWELSKALNK